ncbi:MAG: hypothetical protein M0Z28_09615 [Rhodospirillales bacterium]|nr:hypothetical protein [Rhodospirillales bacterium]
MQTQINTLTGRPAHQVGPYAVRLINSAGGYLTLDGADLDALKARAEAEIARGAYVRMEWSANAKEALARRVS